MTRLVDANGVSVEVTPTHYVVRDRHGILVGQHPGVRAPMPTTPAELVTLGVDLATLEEAAA